ncbi:hypothetical protein DYI21_03595 [Thalassospira tepidiphila]|uniref:hypothetical protein n=1 Tax=Thalassospira tepidiphila TaxID=393657 RepID=UPI001BCC5022|nr:hypothetical protein [Thalassospira tepidiphila]MBS8272663.1 hypothetical protein [Thalassospira tepidiphila]
MPFTRRFKSIATGLLFVGGSITFALPAMSHPADHTHTHASIELAQAGGIFSDEERRIIRDVLDVADIVTEDDTEKSDGQNGKKDKGGKGKGNKGLPPGIVMKLERGGTLPPGIAKRDLPGNVVAKLPKRSDGAIRQIVGDDVVLIEKGTDIILDVIRDVAGN